jgi:hypothetical protein
MKRVTFDMTAFSSDEEEAGFKIRVPTPPPTESDDDEETPPVDEETAVDGETAVGEDADALFTSEDSS